jgi:glycosyltransferase involved in cell wall biosynthesis
MTNKDEINAPLNLTLSVMMLTYNHEKFIARAIESVLSQKANFNIELIIGEDCSTDTTRTICLDYQKRYPKIIKVLLEPKNLGVKKNFVRTLKACNGDFVAYLEGDDYWVSEIKLQKQIDYLLAHKRSMMCCHNATVIDEISHSSYKLLNITKQNWELSDICNINLICANSVVFRNDKNVLKNFKLESDIADWVLWVYLAQFGSIHYINEELSVYRIHQNGIYAGSDIVKRYEMTILAADNWKRLIGNKCNKQHATLVGNCALEACRSLLNSNKPDRTKLAFFIKKLSDSVAEGGEIVNQLRPLAQNITGSSTIFIYIKRIMPKALKKVIKKVINYK